MGYMGKLLHTHRHILVGILLAVITLAAFWRVLECDFINYDDNLYVTENRHVQAGFTRESVRWALTARYEATWQPLVWLSYILDYQLYGLRAYGYHLTNLLLHIANTLLLFLIFRRMTGSLWRSAFVAVLFAIHPLHVESVAWVAERKDVLSTLFWVLTIWAYFSYTKRPEIKSYLLVILAFALGLMAKPVLVTLPFALLLLDFWPLCRFPRHWKLLWEKVPLFALAVGSCVMTSITLQEGGALSSLERLPFDVRLANALISYVKYIRKMLWPRDLAIIYPHPMAGLPVWQVMGAVLALVCLSALIIRAVRRRPYLAVGWLWYIGTLVPMIGLAQVGTQALADRYTYVPLIGIFIIVAWGVPDLPALGKAERRYSRVLPVLAGAVTAVLIVCTWIQVGYWRSSVTVFQHAIRVTTNNYLAHSNLGLALDAQGKTDQALRHLREALAIQPDYAPIQTNLGVILFKQGRLDEAAAYFREAVRLEPGMAEGHLDLGVALAEQGKLEEAIGEFSKALEINPNLEEARCNLETISREIERRKAASLVASKSPGSKPDDAMGHYKAAVALDEQGKTDEAIREYREAIRLNPNFAAAYNNLGFALRSQSRDNEAIWEYLEAIRLKPDLAAAHNNLAVSLYFTGDYAGAWKEVRLCRKYGINPHPGFLEALSQKMPEPAE